ncbi:unnamed protein product [Diatraea saccharalis]|uniref:Uncharacterized protein n=1 Tax=Diatraea saccharalis TaxID=40085 RepID=A0A9N9QXD7_9NEOP|nr:unnamed protein product [Diatraea saccharalis]
MPSFLAESSNASTDNKSRATPDSQKLGFYRGGVTNVNLVGIGNPLPNNISGIAKERADRERISEEHTTDSIAEEKSPNEVDAETAPTSKTNVNNTNVEIVQNLTTVIASEKDNMNVNKGQSEMENSLSLGAVTRQSNRWRHSTAECLACVRTRPPSSHELREAFFAGMEGLESRSPPSSPSPSERSPHAEVLHYVHYMSNPTHLKQVSL